MASMPDNAGHSQVPIPLQNGSFINWGSPDDEGDVFRQLNLEWDLSECLDACKPHDATAGISYKQPGFRNASEDIDSDVSSSNYSTSMANSLILTPAGSEYNNTSTLMKQESNGSSYLRTDTEESLTQSRIHSASPSTEGMKSDSNASRCITLCARLVEYIDTENLNTPRPLDQVMKINQVVICEITRIRELKNLGTSMPCQMLIYTALDTIIVLFESSLHSISPAALLPNFSFGSFQITSEQHIAFGVRCVVTEIQRTIHAIEAFDHDNNAAQSTSGYALENWSADMIRRLKIVITAVEKSV